MMSSLQTPTHRRWAAPIIIGLALIGFADAAFLTVEHFRGSIIPCNIIRGCQLVTTSRYATIGPIPIALMGAMYYLSVLVVAALTLENSRANWLKRLPWLTAIGFTFSLYLVGLQAFVLHAFCFYCLLSATTSTLIFVVSLVGRRGLDTYYKV